MLRGYAGDDHALPVQTVTDELVSGRSEISRPGLFDWVTGRAVAEESLESGRVISSKRDWAILSAEQAAARMMVCGDLVFVPCGEPVYQRVDVNASCYFSATNTEAVTRIAGDDEIIPADRLDLVAEALRRHGVREPDLIDPVSSERVWHPIEVLRPDLIRYRHDEEPRLRKAADVLVHEAREIIKRGIDETSPELLKAFHLLRDRNGSSLPAAELAVAMAEFRAELAGERWSWTIQKLDESLADWDKFTAEKADDEALGQFR